MNSIPLQLNQSALQDFLDCPRRFELRYLNETAWPAAQGSPLSKYESLTELGTSFHKHCHQFFLGIDPQLLASSILDSQLLELWEAFLPEGEKFLALPFAVEQILRIPFGSHFLVAKYDLIVQQSEDTFLIIDWKTSRNKPDRTTLGNRVQTYLYPYVFQNAASDLFPRLAHNSLKIIMRYYYPLSSSPEELFFHSEGEHKQAQKILQSQITQIETFLAQSQPFPLTENLKQCQYCLYRSYCERGYDSSPQPLGLDLENEDLSNHHFDLDLIKEIDY